MARAGGEITSATVALIAVVTALVLLCVSAPVGRPSGGPPVADHATLEIALAQATETPRLVGSYSRFGWSHPGPMLHNLLLPVYVAAGRSTGAVHLAAGLVNLAAAIGILLLARRAGNPALLSAALALAFLLRHLGPATLVDPWNPHVTLLPFGLYLFVAAAVAVGEIRWLPLLAVVGSFLVQTHVGYAPAVAVSGGGAAACALARRPRKQAPPALRVTLLTVAVTAILWAPPIIEQLRSSPGNLERIFSHFRVPSNSTDWAGAGLATLSRWAALPLQLAGRWPPLSPMTEHAPPFVPTAGAVWVAAGLQLLLLGAAMTMALRRRSHRTAALALLALLMLPLSLAAVARAGKEPLSYLLEWVAVSSLPAWTAIGQEAALGVRAVVRSRWAGTATASAAVVGVVLLLLPLGRTALRPATLFPPTNGWPATVAALAPAAAAWLERTGARPLFRHEGAETIPIAVGLLCELDRRGHRLAAPPAWGTLFGERRPWAGDGRFELLLSAEGAEPPAGSEVVARSGRMTLLAMPAGRIAWGPGWMPEEPWGRWACERSALLRFAGASGGRIEIEAAPATAEPQDVQVFADGRSVGRFLVETPPWHWQEIAFEVPPGTAELRFHFGRLNRSPEDGRYRALALHSLTASGQ